MYVCLGLWFIVSFLQANSFVRVLAMRSQTRINALFNILLALCLLSCSLPRIVDLDSTVESREDDAVQKQDAVQNVTDLWLRENSSCSPKTHPQRNGPQ